MTTDRRSAGAGEVYEEVNGSLPATKGFLEDLGGGKTLPGGLRIALSDLLPETGTKNLAGVLLHEMLYHIHPLGEKETSANEMKNFYDVEGGYDHMVDPHNQIQDGRFSKEQLDLDNQRAKTGARK
jgi:hypothetical protein